MSQRDAPGAPFRGEGDDAIWSPREEGALRSPPTLKGPLGLNYCDISASVAGDGRRAVVASSLDNLLKGQSGSAMQNLNLMFGLPQTIGLERGAALSIRYMGLYSCSARGTVRDLQT